MESTTSWRIIFVALFMFALFGVGISDVQGKNQQWEDRGICRDLTLENIPLMGDDSIPMGEPQSNLSITQEYNPEHGVYFNGKINYGHNGLDTVGGKEIKSLLKGVVILSREDSKTHGWGETIMVATRPNPASEEIITIHYHHMKNVKTQNTYWTSRQFQACNIVQSGDNIGEMGKTGSVTGAHLHTTIRRWANLAELKATLESTSTLNASNVQTLYGKAYASKGVTSHLKKNLDPVGLIYNTFDDYVAENGNQPAYAWSLPYVLNMRKPGIEFGLFDGRYGAQDQVRRREAARWIKIARGLASASNVTNFGDLPLNDPDYPYIQALAKFPASMPVIDPERDCNGDGNPNFCPDSIINRPEALKMVIMAFYGNEFLEMFDNTFWKGAVEYVFPLFDNFQDVTGGEWFAPYLYFGMRKGLVANNDYLHPTAAVFREEIAKWITMGYEHVNGSLSAVCLNTLCPEGSYCYPTNGECTTLPECVPTTDNPCEIGGGIDENSCNPGDCTPGETKQQSCGNGGTQTATCNGSCTWGAWGNCTGEGNCTSGQTDSCGNCGTMTCGSNGQWGSCQNQGVCQPGQQQNQTCNSVGTQTKTCSSSCNWSGWAQCTAECSPGQTQQQSCTVNGQSGTKERSCNSSGQWGSWSSCQSSCQDTYLASSSQSCYNNPQGSGNPTLCLNVQQNSGASWKYRICKQGGAFSNSFSHQLKDDNHTVNYSTYNESTGVTCTNWKSFNLNQVTGYGAMNGAGLRAYIKSPTSCSQAACQYYTGSITIRKECL
ncbi:M23 family metallopeptidase [Candidatus Peregrinibacteria bacterium]|nr:M23 family metallopeptidase [Candidatus Peregrinibacteria bacterium]